MDKLLVSLAHARELSGFQGTLEEFKRSDEVVFWATQNNRVVRLQPHEMSALIKEKYTNYLVALTRRYLKDHPDITALSPE